MSNEIVKNIKLKIPQKYEETFRNLGSYLKTKFNIFDDRIVFPFSEFIKRILECFENFENCWKRKTLYELFENIEVKSYTSTNISEKLDLILNQLSQINSKLNNLLNFVQENIDNINVEIIPNLELTYFNFISYKDLDLSDLQNMLINYFGFNILNYETNEIEKIRNEIEEIKQNLKYNDIDEILNEIEKIFGRGIDIILNLRYSLVKSISSTFSIEIPKESYRHIDNFKINELISFLNSKLNELGNERKLKVVEIIEQLKLFQKLNNLSIKLNELEEECKKFHKIYGFSKDVYYWYLNRLMKLNEFDSWNDFEKVLFKKLFVLFNDVKYVFDLNLVNVCKNISNFLYIDRFYEFCKNCLINDMNFWFNISKRRWQNFISSLKYLQINSLVLYYLIEYSLPCLWRFEDNNVSSFVKVVKHISHSYFYEPMFLQKYEVFNDCVKVYTNVNIVNPFLIEKLVNEYGKKFELNVFVDNFSISFYLRLIFISKFIDIIFTLIYSCLINESCRFEIKQIISNLLIDEVVNLLSFKNYSFDIKLLVQYFSNECLFNFISFKIFENNNFVFDLLDVLLNYCDFIRDISRFRSYFESLVYS